MKNTIIALAMTASLLFVGSPAQANDPVDPMGNPTTAECGQAYEDAYTTYNEMQWQIELKQRAQIKVQKQRATIKELRREIRQLKRQLKNR